MSQACPQNDLMPQASEKADQDFVRLNADPSQNIEDASGTKITEDLQDTKDTSNAVLVGSESTHDVFMIKHEHLHASSPLDLPCW
jgi:hypothetical protein